MHSRVVSQRLGLMKGWTGANRAKGAKRGDTEDRDAKLKCDLCDLEDTRDHFICTCLCDNLQTIRDGTIRELNSYIKAMRSVRSREEIQLAEAYRAFALEDINGWRAWLGQLTFDILSLLKSKCPSLAANRTVSWQTKRDLRKTAQQVGSILASGARALWKRRQELIAERVSLSKVVKKIYRRPQPKDPKAYRTRSSISITSYT